MSLCLKPGRGFHQALPRDIVWRTGRNAGLHAIRAVQAQRVIGLVLVAVIWVMETIQVDI